MELWAATTAVQAFAYPAIGLFAKAAWLCATIAIESFAMHARSPRNMYTMNVAKGNAQPVIKLFATGARLWLVTSAKLHPLNKPKKPKMQNVCIIALDQHQRVVTLEKELAMKTIFMKHLYKNDGITMCNNCAYPSYVGGRNQCKCGTLGCHKCVRFLCSVCNKLCCESCMPICTYCNRRLCTQCEISHHKHSACCSIQCTACQQFQCTHCSFQLPCWVCDQ